MRVTGWAKHLRNLMASRPKTNVYTEAELLAYLVESGRSINRDWRSVLAHAMRALGWHRCGDAVYRREGHVVARGGAS